MCVEPLVLPHEPGGDPSQPVDIPEAVSAEDKLAAALAIEEWLPKLVALDIKDERKKLKLSALKGQ